MNSCTRNPLKCVDTVGSVQNYIRLTGYFFVYCCTSEAQEVTNLQNSNTFYYHWYQQEENTWDKSTFSLVWMTRSLTHQNLNFLKWMRIRNRAYWFLMKVWEPIELNVKSLKLNEVENSGNENQQTSKTADRRANYVLGLQVFFFGEHVFSSSICC